MRKLFVLAVVAFLLAVTSPAWACAALIGARGSLQLGRTTTLAAHVDGKEHYITAFEFSGGGGEFGSIVPLPGIPEKVEKAGEWTLQRLIRETQARFQPAGLALGSAGSDQQSAEVIQEVRIDALDVTILRGGGSEVGVWAKEHGFLLPPDAPEVLDFYARRSPIFLAAVFDAKAAEERGQQFGDATPIHVTIPIGNPWVPLRILTLGKPTDSTVDASVYLLTERRPVLLPVRSQGMELRLREPASPNLLADLRSDAGMEWLPATGMWLTYMEINAPTPSLRFDLATSVAAGGRPSYRMAGLPEPVSRPDTASPVPSPSPAPTPSPSSIPAPSAVVAGEQRFDPSAKFWALGAFGLVALALATWKLSYPRR